MSDEREELSFEDLLTELQGLVERLESGQLSLEASLELYERGVALARQGNERLDQAEARVEVLQQSMREGAS